LQRTQRASQRQKAIDQKHRALPSLPSRVKQEPWSSTPVPFQFVKARDDDAISDDAGVDIVAELLTNRRRRKGLDINDLLIHLFI